MRTTATIAASLLVASTASAKAPLEVEMVGDEKYAEQIVAIADLEDGTYAKVHFGISNVGPGDGKGACRFMVIEPNGTVINDEKVVDRDGWSYDAAKKTIAIAECSGVESDALTMRAKLPKGTVEIKLSARPKRTRAHVARYGDDFYELDTLVPWADAEVTINVGSKRRTLKGRGYADHPRSKILPGTLARQWFRFRGLTGDDPRLVLIRFPKAGRPIGWHQSGSGQTKVTRAQMKLGNNKQWRTMLKGARGEWRVTTSKLLHRSAPVEDRGAVLGSMISAIVGNPVTYTFRGVLEERGSKKRIPGIVEITLTDE